MRKHNYYIKESMDNRVFNWIVTLLLVLFGLLALYPIAFVIVASVSDPVRVNSGDVWLWPIGFQLDGYKQVFQNQWIFIGYRNSLLYTAAGTFLNVLVTVMAAYSLSRKDLFGRPLFSWLVAIPMWFGGWAHPHLYCDKPAESAEHACDSDSDRTGQQL